ncbi:MAG: cob(I)yrinic acid a,c-diamide adenosyltransferase [Deferribacterota bacterium]|nr:cob(I)yrinic acid a,c-diamide adenosyltransferase [Deferribacterota bacterium]
MSISTKKGDQGYTSIYTGERVSKDDIICEICGTGDEFICHLGELKLKSGIYLSVIEDIQKKIFKINSYFATKGEKKKDFIITEKEYLTLNDLLDSYENKCGPIKGFIIPSENLLAAKADICRTICRRYERRIVSYNNNIQKVHNNILKYVNRLSDVLYIMARLLGKK